MKFLIFDTETLGIDPAVHPVLTATFLVTDEKIKPIDKLELFVKYETYNAAIGALQVNNINLVDHHNNPKAKNRVDAAFALKAFLTKHGSRQDFLVPVGHNVITFDIPMVKSWFPECQWNQTVSYKALDTMTLAYGLQLAGKIPSDLKLSLASLATHFGIAQKAAHTASDDVLVTAKLLKKLLGLIK